jgi:transposase-like protein/DDE family transposase
MAPEQRGQSGMLLRVLTEEEARREEIVRAEQAAIAARARNLLGTMPSLREEMLKADFGLKRINARYERVFDALSAAPEKSFPRQCRTNGELVALYRFLDNHRVTGARILQPHVQETCERVKRLGKALSVHDSSGVSLGGKGTREGMGPLGDGGHGYYLHPSLAVSADSQRVPLGVLRYETLVREAKPKGQKKEPQPKNSRKKDPDRESLRWWRGVEESEKLFEGTDVELIHVMDREGDDFELEGRMLAAGHRFVLRMQHDRLLALSKEARDHGEPAKVREALSQAQASLEREVRLSPRKRDRSGEKRKTYPEREGRVARLQASAMRLSLRRPNGLGSIDVPLPPSLELNVVRVWEVDAPEGVEPVEWYLLTTEPIDTPAQIEEIIDFYRARWIIEEFFKALKTGCSLEKRQLENHRSLLNALSIFLPIALRLLLLRSLARTTPHLPATVVLCELQIKLLAHSRPKLALPAQPTVAEALLAIASLGGHIKHNGPPGWQVLGRGFEKLLDLEEAVLFVQNHLRNDSGEKTSVQS